MIVNDTAAADRVPAVAVNAAVSVPSATSSSTTVTSTSTVVASLAMIAVNGDGTVKSAVPAVLAAANANVTVVAALAG